MNQRKIKQSFVYLNNDKIVSENRILILFNGKVLGKNIVEVRIKWGILIPVLVFKRR